MVRTGRLAGIVTQNIDNLHQDSGVPGDRLLERLTFWGEVPRSERSDGSFGGTRSRS